MIFIKQETKELIVKLNAPRTSKPFKYVLSNSRSEAIELMLYGYYGEEELNPNDYPKGFKLVMDNKEEINIAFGTVVVLGEAKKFHDKKMSIYEIERYSGKETLVENVKLNLEYN